MTDSHRFTATSGCEVVETTTPSGDWSFAWHEQRGLDDVAMEAVWVLGRGRWVRFVGDQGPAHAQDVDWPTAAHRPAARAIVKERAGR